MTTRTAIIIFLIAMAGGGFLWATLSDDGAAPAQADFEPPTGDVDEWIEAMMATPYGEQLDHPDPATFWRQSLDFTCFSLRGQGIDGVLESLESAEGSYQVEGEYEAARLGAQLADDWSLC